VVRFVSSSGGSCADGGGLFVVFDAGEEVVEVGLGEFPFEWAAVAL
jgi:hypothetical protein